MTKEEENKRIISLEGPNDSSSALAQWVHHMSKFSLSARASAAILCRPLDPHFFCLPPIMAHHHHHAAGEPHHHHAGGGEHHQHPPGAGGAEPPTPALFFKNIWGYFKTEVLGAFSNGSAAT